MNRTRKFIYTFFVGLLFLGFAVSLNFEELQLFPITPSSGVRFKIAHEGVQENWSQASVQLEKNGDLAFRYKLSSELIEPFAGVYFNKYAATDSFFNFSSFDELLIKLSAQKAKRIPVYITIDYKEKLKPDNLFPYIPLVYVIDYEKEGVYSIRKHDFEIPSWWLRYQGLKKEDLGTLDFSKVNYILINSCQVIGANKEDKITIANISMSNSNTINYWLFGGLLVLAICIFSIDKLLLARRILVPYKANELGVSNEVNKTQKIIHFIGQNYSQPELSLDDIQKALGISGREIGVLIKKEFDTTFKAYLNLIRLTEVKRLLKETDLSVSEIAYKTGYGNVSHFNRVFKKEFDLSPKEFREESKISLNN